MNMVLGSYKRQLRESNSSVAAYWPNRDDRKPPIHLRRSGTAGRLRRFISLTLSRHFQSPTYRALSCIQLARVVREHRGLLQPPATLFSGSAAPAAVRSCAAPILVECALMRDSGRVGSSSMFFGNAFERARSFSRSNDPRADLSVAIERRNTAPREREMRDQLDQPLARNAVVERLLQVERQLVCPIKRD